MKARKLAAGLAASLAMSGIALALSVSAPAYSADASSTVTTEELCEWRMVGAPTAITMSSGVNEYKGSTLEMAQNFTSTSGTAGADETFTVYATGNQQAAGGSRTEFNECTFYGTNKTKALVSVGLSAKDGNTAVKFNAVDEAGTADTGMSFGIGTDAGESTFDISLTDTSACAAPWSASALTLGLDNADDTVGDETSSGTLVTIPIANVDGTGYTTAGGTDRCLAPMKISTDIPANLLPDTPGDDYTWSGIVLTFTLSSPTSD